MSRKLFPLLLFSIFTTMTSMAQHASAPNALTVRRTAINYQFPFTPSTDKLIKWHDYQSGLELAYTRNISSFANLSIPIRAANVNLPLNKGETQDDILIIGTDLIGQFGHFNQHSILNPYFYTGIGGVLEDLQDISLSAPVGIGLNIRLGRNFKLNMQSDYRFGYPSPRNNLQVGAGIMVLFGNDKRLSKAERKRLKAEELAATTDTDGDGVMDSYDRCPHKAGSALAKGCPDMDGDQVADEEDRCPDLAGLATMGGCPDADNDGIADIDDNCPTEAGLKEDAGCPKIIDTDGDGVEDELDACPDLVGSPKDSGCPDTDADGLADHLDTCPQEAGTMATKGCPDADEDGVANNIDNCPNEAGTINNKGCPEINEEEKAILDMAMYAVRFDLGDARVAEESWPILNQVIEILNKHPEYKMRINGHADSIGHRVDNLKLSQKRAKACYDYMIAHGAARERLSYKGYGEAKPIATNMYKDGRQLNRRVVFEMHLDN